jgi:hypothetical protein
MRIIRQQRLTALRVSTADDPIVRPFDFRKDDATLRLREVGERRRIDAGQIQSARGIVGSLGIRRKKFIDARCAERRHELRPYQLVLGVARHRERGHPLKRHLRGPRLGLDAEQFELDRWMVADFGDVGVHALRERLDDLACVGRVVGVLGVHVAAVLEQAGNSVASHRRRPEHLGEAAVALTAPHLHLEEPILGDDVTLRDEEVVLGLRIDVRHAPTVAAHLDGAVERREDHRTVERGEPRLRTLGQRLSGTGAWHRDRDCCQQYCCERASPSVHDHSSPGTRPGVI